MSNPTADGGCGDRSRDQVRVTENTTVRFAPTEVQDVDLEDLAFVADVTVEDGELLECEIDLRRLVDAMTVFSSLERQRYDWR